MRKRGGTLETVGGRDKRVGPRYRRGLAGRLASLTLMCRPNEDEAEMKSLPFPDPLQLFKKHKGRDAIVEREAEALT